jgi:hypothetical protein
MRQRFRPLLGFASVVAATLVGCIMLAAPVAGADSGFKVRLLPHSYVTFQRGHHPPQHREHGYFGRGAWHKVKDCGLHGTHKGKRVHIIIGNHRITNPHSFGVSVKCQQHSAA